MIEITVLAPGSKEAEDLEQRVRREIDEGKAYVRKHGGKSTEGFFETEDGPTGFQDAD